MSNEMIPTPGNDLSCAISQIVLPIIEPLCKMLKQNTEALERISATLNLQGKQIEDLERQIRMNTPVSAVQSKCINRLIREKSRDLLDRYGICDKAYIDMLSRKIRREILMRNGIASVREFPKCEYDVVVRQIDMWNNALLIRDVIKEAKQHEAIE